jgi:hypothetical protein
MSTLRGTACAGAVKAADAAARIATEASLAIMVVLRSDT